MLNTFLETLLTVTFISECGQILQNCESVCVIFLYKLLNNHEAIMCDKEVSKPHETNMPRISLQRAEAVFPALKQSSVSVLHRLSIYQLVLCCLYYPVYSQSVTYAQLALRFMQIFSLSLQHILCIEIFPYPKLGSLEFLRISGM